MKWWTWKDPVDIYLIRAKMAETDSRERERERQLRHMRKKPGDYDQRDYWEMLAQLIRGSGPRPSSCLHNLLCWGGLGPRGNFSDKCNFCLPSRVPPRYCCFKTFLLKYLLIDYDKTCFFFLLSTSFMLNRLASWLAGRAMWVIKIFQFYHFGFGAWPIMTWRYIFRFHAGWGPRPRSLMQCS